MSPLPDPPTTRIASSTAEDIFVRGKSLCRELIGNLTFTQMAYFDITGRLPTPGQTAVVDACLVTLMEHGLTPSAIATRLVYSSAPEAMQAAVAAGIQGVGSLFVGTVEGCAALLERVLRAASGTTGAASAEARRIAEEHRAARRPIAGFGHPLHKPDDPRPACIFRVAEEAAISGSHIEALRLLASAVDEVFGKHITINATGAVAAALADAGVPNEIMRGFAIVARCAGLVAHVHEEQHHPAMRALWEAAERAVPYEAPPNDSRDPTNPGKSTP
jgi:citrate synthase